MRQRLPVTARISRGARILLPTAVLLIVCVGAFPGIVLYQITRPAASREPTDPSFYMLESSDIEVTSDGGDRIQGWWIPGGDGAAGVILAPGFGMSRSDALSLAAALQKNGFNVFLYGQRGGSASHEKSSTFGLKEAGDMLLAVQFVQSRAESGRTHIGLWGVDVGAYAALQAAATIPEVRAIAADSAYASISDFLNVRISEEFELDHPLLRFGCIQIFRIRHMASGALRARRIPVEKLSGRSILIVTGDNRKTLGRMATALYDTLPPGAEKVSLETSRIHLMEGDALQDYDALMVDFFRKNLQ